MITSPESADELLSRMLAAYARASFYADRGTALTSHTRTVFKTSFVRGRRFRFEHSSASGPHVIWSDGASTYTQWAVAARLGRAEIGDDGANLATAVHSATGISSGTAYTVPAMLLPVSVGPACQGRRGELTLDGIENVDGHSCARVIETTPQHSTVLWIGRGTYLLHRVVDRFPTFETTTSYEPSLDPIDVASIEPPDIAKTPPQPREPVAWTGIEIAIDSRRIENIAHGSPAARSGIQVDDEIEAMNGRPMAGFADALKALHFAKVGERLALTVQRGGDRLSFILVVEIAPSPPSRPAPSAPLVE